MFDRTFFRRLIVLNALVPGAILAWDAVGGQLGANAANKALHITGSLSLVFLMLTLAITPLKLLTASANWIALRRTLGLSAFGYGVLHLGIYVVFDRDGNLSSALSEIASRRFLQIGMVAFLLMLPLAVTSTNRMIQRIGARRWKLLHRLTYVVAILGVVHYYLLVKSDVRQPLAFAAVLTPLLALRLKELFWASGSNSRSRSHVERTAERNARPHSAASPDIILPAETSRITYLPAGITAQSSPGATILESAEDFGVTIPFECRSGICGQCRVLCKSGTATMPLNVALSAKERQQGFILACQAVPASSEVQIVV